MTHPAIHIISAMDRNGLIGNGNALPWRLPADMKFFRTTTMGYPVIMGRTTWESLPKALDGRQNIVLSRRAGLVLNGAQQACSIAEAIEKAEGDKVFVIGGADIYTQFLPMADSLYLTEIDADFEGDTWFPKFDRELWQELARETHQADERNQYPYAFVHLGKV